MAEQLSINAIVTLSDKEQADIDRIEKLYADDHVNDENRTALETIVLHRIKTRLELVGLTDVELDWY